MAPAENQLRLHKALTLFEKAGDSRGCLLSLANLIQATVSRGHDLIPISVLLAKGEDLLNTLGHNLYPRERAHLWLRMAGAFTLRAGNARKGYWAGQNAYLLARETKDIVLQSEAVFYTSEALIYQGEYLLAEEKLAEIEKLIRKHPYPEMVMWYHIMRFYCLLDKGAFEKADELIQFVKRESEGLGIIFLYVAALVHELMVKPHLGQYTEAEELGQRLLQFSTFIKASFVSGLTLLSLGRSAYFEGDFEKAQDYFQKSRDILSKEEVLSPFNLSLIGILNGFLWRPGEPEAPILKGLQNALDSFPSQSSVHAVEAYWAIALFFRRQGDRKKAAAHLHSGFKMAREKGFSFFSFTSPQDMARVCALAIELGDQEDSDYAADLLSTRLSSQAEPELEMLSKHRDPSIRAKATEIGLSLHRSALPILKIKTLRGFRVIRSGSPVPEEEWRGSQAKNLLKAIVAFGEEGVRREVLIESLWPEGEPDKTGNIFNVTLHRLRRALEPAIDKRYGYSYVLLEENRVSLDKGICECDVDQSLALLQEGEKREESWQMKEALTAYLGAVDLYQGDFLTDDEYAEWADPKREELRQKYLGLLFKMARIYEDRGTPRKAISMYQKAVKFDPFSEEAYRRLMVLYDGLGKRNEAIKIYRVGEKTLREGLDTEPEALTVSLYKKIESS
jgi:DNA-binding SARP family transcriptional activator